jgi:hypothetical protein
MVFAVLCCADRWRSPEGSSTADESMGEEIKLKNLPGFQLESIDGTIARSKQAADSVPQVGNQSVLLPEASAAVGEKSLRPHESSDSVVEVQREWNGRSYGQTTSPVCESGPEVDIL